MRSAKVVDAAHEKLHEAIEAVEKLCDWLEPQWRSGPKKLPQEPEAP